MQRAFELMVSFTLNFNENNVDAVLGPQKSRLQVYNWLLTNQVEFWKFNSISEEQFLRQVDTGDILLFRCNSQSIFGAWITRAFTNSHYDHVSILMRFGPQLKDLYILEAVGDKGVRLTSWISVRRELYAGGFFDKIVTRKLLYDMSEERLAELDNFRRNSVGHEYGLKLNKILIPHKSRGKIGAK